MLIVEDATVTEI